MFRLRYFFVFLIASVVFYFSLLSSSFADVYISRQITDNTANDIAPSLNNGQIAWRSNADGDYDIYHWDGSSTINVSDNSADDNSPSLSNGQIAWSSNADTNYDIYFWDGSSTTNVTNNTTTNYSPSLSNEQIAWQLDVNSNWNIAFWDGSSISYITYSSNYADLNPSLSDGQIAWQNNMKYPGYTSFNYEIYLWDGSSITHITNQPTNRMDRYPSVSNGQIAWSELGLGIAYWNGSSITHISSETDSLVLNNGQIAWSNDSDGDNDIYLWDGSSITNVSNNSASDTTPSLYNGHIAWSSNLDGDNEIYFAKLASEWIAEALPGINLNNFTEQEIMDLADLYSNQTSAVVNGMEWTYLSGDLPGDTNGEIYEIGDSWIYEGVYYIKLGSGLASTGSVPEIPDSLALVFLPAGILFNRLRKNNRMAKLKYTKIR